MWETAELLIILWVCHFEEHLTMDQWLCVSIKMQIDAALTKAILISTVL